MNSLLSLRGPLGLSIAEQLNIISWEWDFDKNYKIFAENLACGIANKIIEKLGKKIKDPNERPIDDTNKFNYIVSLEIIRSRAAKKILKLNEDSKRLPPFNTWLEIFSDEKEEEKACVAEILREKSEEFFVKSMANVGLIAEEKLKKIFSEFKSNSENNGPEFKIKIYKRFDVYNPSGTQESCLAVQLWFNEKEFQIEEKKSSIEQTRIKQKEIKKIDEPNNVVIALRIVIIAFMIGEVCKLLF